MLETYLGFNFKIESFIDQKNNSLTNKLENATVGFDVENVISNAVLANGLWALCALLMLVLTRTRKVLLAFALLAWSVMGFAGDHDGHDATWRSNIEWQVGVGQTQFDLNSPITFTDDHDPQYSISVGYRVHENWLVQYRYTDLGVQQVSNTQKLDYAANSINIQATLPVFKDLPIMAYSLIGAAALDIDAQGISVEDDAPTELQLGLGIKGQIDSATLGVEVTSYSEDAWTWSLMVGGHF